MKKLLSTLMIATVLGSASYSPKSNAGIAILSGTAVYCGLKCVEHSRGLGIFLTPVTVGGGVLLSAGPIAGGALMIAAGGIGLVPGVVLLVFSEDGSVSQQTLETNLSERYSFIADREVITAMASQIKSKADSMKADDKGMKMVSLSQEEVEAILAPADLTAEEVAAVVQDLK